MKFSIEKTALTIQAGKIDINIIWHIIPIMSSAAEQNGKALEVLQKIIHSRMESGAGAIACLFDLPDNVKVVMMDQATKTLYEGSAQIERGKFEAVKATIPDIKKLDYNQLLALTDYLSQEENNPLVCDMNTAEIISQDPNSTMLYCTVEPRSYIIYPMGLLTRKKDEKLLGSVELFIVE